MESESLFDRFVLSLMPESDDIEQIIKSEKDRENKANSLNSVGKYLSISTDVSIFMTKMICFT